MNTLTTRPLWRLEDLLVLCSQPEELHRWLARAFPPLAAELPNAQSPPVQFVHDAVGLLERHGWISPALFAQLLRWRPLRRSQILSVAGALAVEGAAIEALGDDDQTTHVFRSPALFDPKLVDALEELILERARCSSDDPRRAALSEDIERIAAQIRARKPPRAGDRVAGTILEYVLGRGTFGAVWRSHDEETGAPRATKIFDPGRLTDGIMLWRFRRSFRALAALNQRRGAPRSIPQIFAVADDGLAFAMEYFPGSALDRLAERTWTLEHKVAVFSEICRAVAFAHQAGVVHRDIKPDNVMFRADLRPVVIDFDIADVQFLTEQNLTLGGLGNMMFAAPEQLECAGEVDERADIFSLGRLLHYMLIERVPSYLQQGSQLSDLSHLPPSLSLAVRKATQRQPKDRFASVHQLRREVEAYKTGWSACRAHARRSVLWARRNAVLLTLSLCGSTGSLLHARQQEVHAAAVEAQSVQITTLSQELAQLQRALALTQARHRQLESLLADAQARLTDLERSDRGSLTQAERETHAARQDDLHREINDLEHDLRATEDQLAEIRQAMERTLEQLRAAGGHHVESADPGEAPPRELTARPVTPTPVDPHPLPATTTAPHPPEPRARPKRRPSTPVQRQAEVERVLRTMEGALKRCRDRGTSRWTRITISFGVGASGRVLGFKIGPSGIISESTFKCIERRIRGHRFSPSTQESPHHHPMGFA